MVHLVPVASAMRRSMKNLSARGLLRQGVSTPSAGVSCLRTHNHAAVKARSSIISPLTQYTCRQARVCILAASFFSTVIEQTQAAVSAPTDTISYQQNDAAANPPTSVKATGRIVAIGDLHGDLRKAVKSLELAGVMNSVDGQFAWCGGDTTVVQMGDVLDRGDSEIAIIMLLRELDVQARKEGGAVYMINGNHESLNVCRDFRYVTQGAFMESALVAGLDESTGPVGWNDVLRARDMLWAPGGPLAVELAKNPTVLIVNDTVFAHGGLLPVHVQYGLDRLNAEVAAWMRGDQTADGSGMAAPPPHMAMGNSQSVMWNRQFSRERFTPIEKLHACSVLKQLLAQIGCERLVVGHTPQIRGVNCECDGRVWRTDVGMSSGVLNAGVQVLEIAKQADGQTKVKVVSESSMLDSYDEKDVAVEL